MDSGNSPVFASQSDGIAHVEIERDSMFHFNFVTFKVTIYAKTATVEKSKLNFCLAEDRLFRVPKHEFEEQSHVFRDMLLMPAAEGKGEVEGTSDDNPIHLEAIDKEAFKLLLKLLYPPRARDIASSLTVEQCSSLLKLSHMWGFDNIRLIARSRIRKVLWNTIQPADKIRLAHDYELEDWYADAYFELAARSEPLSIEEAYKLGLEISTKMAHVRENVVIARNGRSRGIHDVARAATDEVFLVVPAFEPQSPPPPEECDPSWYRTESVEEQAYADAWQWQWHRHRQNLKQWQRHRHRKKRQEQRRNGG